MGEREELLPKDLPADTIAAVVGGGVTSDQVKNIWGLIRSALLLRDMTGSSLTGVYDPAIRAHAQGPLPPTADLDPADVWEEYLEEVGDGERSAQGALAFGFWAAYNALRAPEAADAKDARIASLLADIELLEKNAGIQAKLLADTKRAADAGVVAPIGWRWRHRGSNDLGWQWSTHEPTGPSLHCFEVQPLYASPTDAGMRERAALGFCKWLKGYLSVGDEDLTAFHAATIRKELASALASTERGATTGGGE